MPQKRNPDSLELMRGKSGRITGHLVGMLTTLKGLPSAYNKDLQEDKEAIFDTLDTLGLELPVATAIVRTLQVNEARMGEALDYAMLATELADYLVRKGVPFRESHHFAGQAVAKAEAAGVSLQQLGLEEYQAINTEFQKDLYGVLDYHQSVAARDAEGGTAPKAVKVQLERAQALLAQ
jgi:argininosuccinate lyase